MTRDRKITFYVTEETGEKLDREADAADETLSGYVNDVVQDHLRRKATDELEDHVHAEDRIRALTAEASDEVRQATREIADMNAKMGAYAVATFELLKDDHKDARRREALSTGARRLREDLDTTLADFDGGAENGDTRRESGGDDDDDDDGDKSLVDELRGDDDG